MPRFDPDQGGKGPDAVEGVIERTSPMPLSQILILGYILAFFTSFVVVIGVVWARQVIDQLRATTTARRSARHTEYRGALKAA
jgi:hypothetical protein